MSNLHCQWCPWVPRALSMELSGHNYLPASWRSRSPGFQPASALPPPTLLTPGTHRGGGVAMLQCPSWAHVCQSPGPLVVFVPRGPGPVPHPEEEPSQCPREGTQLLSRVSSGWG